MKKTITFFLVIMLLLGLTVGCGTQKEEAVEETTDPAVETEEEEPVVLNVRMPAGAPTISMLKMLKESPLELGNVILDFESVKSPDLMAPLLMAGEADIAVIPTNLAPKLYNKGVPITLLGTSVWGILYVVSHEEIESFADLKGQEIHLIGRGLTPDIIVRHLLLQNNINPDEDVTLIYLSGAKDLAPAFLGKKSQVSLMPEPMLSSVLMRNKETIVAFDLQEEWEKVTGLDGGIPQASLVVRNEILEKHPEVVLAFIEKYQEAIAWVNENPALAGKYAEELEIVAKGKVIEMAMPRLNIVFVSAPEARERLEAYFKVLKDHSAEFIGGKLPSDAFYFGE